MFEKDMRLVLLLDFYGDLLGEHRKSIMEMYYCEDLSLAEIAENTGISRQAVRESVKKSENELRSIEDCLHFIERTDTLTQLCSQKADTLRGILPLIHNDEAKEKVESAIAFLSDISI